MKRSFLTEAVRGVAGSFLLAFLTALVWFGFLFCMSDWGFSVKLGMLGGFLVGPAACLGYRLFRGVRERRFGYFATHNCALLAQFPSLPAALTINILPSVGGSLAAAWSRVRQADIRLFLGIWLCGAVLIIVGTGLCQKPLLKYTDSGWFGDPRRAAIEYAGGLFYNCRPNEMPLPDGPLPSRFRVGSSLEVDGATIRTTPSLRNSVCLQVEDVAGVVLGPGSGSNVLYDWQGRSMVKFAWSMENSALFAAYLKENGVLFVDAADYKPMQGR